MNNQMSYCGLVDAKIRASDKDLPVLTENYLPVQCTYTALYNCTDIKAKNQFHVHTYVVNKVRPESK